MIEINAPEFEKTKCNVCGEKAVCEVTFRNEHNGHGIVVALCDDCSAYLMSGKARKKVVKLFAQSVIARTQQNRKEERK